LESKLGEKKNKNKLLKTNLKIANERSEKEIGELEKALQKIKNEFADAEDKWKRRRKT